MGGRQPGRVREIDRYNPRPEPASFCAGGYRVLVDRVEWKIIADPATAANALVNNEVDWLDSRCPTCCRCCARPMA